MSEVDVIEEIIEFAERTDTKIEFVDDNPILQELGGVGGLLRFKITPLTRFILFIFEAIYYLILYRWFYLTFREI